MVLGDAPAARVTTTILFPESPPPNGKDWQTWKMFIFRNFLNGSLTLSRGSIVLSKHSHPLQCPPTSLQRVKELKGMLPTSLPELLAVLPQEYVTLLGHITLPNNLQLLYSLREGDLIAASNGPVRDVDNMGSYRYVLSHKVRNDVQLQGCQTITGTDSLCSLTMEHCGVLCVVLILYMISIQYDECPKNLKVKVYCDNAQVVSRSNDMDYVKVKVSEYNILDYDLWKLTQEIQALLPFHVEYHWVKSHQDAYDDGKPLHGPFARDAELNIMADKLCAQAYRILFFSRWCYY
jgi:hypothetical protein